jgi:hypothetical protein
MIEDRLSDTDSDDTEAGTNGGRKKYPVVEDDSKDAMDTS